MKRNLLFFLGLLVALAVTNGLAAAQTIEPGPATNQIRTAISQTIYDACVGESIAFDGFVHTLVKVGQDQLHLTTVSNFQGMSGVGATTGKLYQLQCAGVTNVFLSDGPITTASVFNAVNLCALAANTSVVMMHEHVTVNPDGTVTVDYSVDNNFCSP